ncbi:FecR domain-containing protein [Aquabacterium sp.]|uniref:FecR domain-containing protein n=1 Tax=Aquabacterium sp. TaxID=1872578 RepID=UPI0024888938|nr:FecR domain-containing protein [Aquabacterium sp.]MDI1258511.1 FecR domain-containing protein [Aquabacterium sp.]
MLHAKRSARAIMLACSAGLGGIHHQASAADDGSLYHHQARAGDTLIGLGQAMLLRPADWPRIARLNRIDNPRRIPIGSSIRIPLALMKSTPVQGAVLAVVGDATLAPARGKAMPAQVGAPIAPGTEIKTGANGYVTVQLADGSVLRIQSATTAQVERSNHYESAGFFASSLRLIQGCLEALVAHMTGGEPRFEVKTPQALLGVRGTYFRITVDEAQQVTRSEVLEGAVSIGTPSRPRQSAQWLAAGFGTHVDQRQGAAALVKLPPGPDLSAVAALHERIVVRINLPSVPGATLYRAQVAKDDTFRQVQGEVTSPTPELRFANLPDAHYHLRVRVANAQGIEGPDAFRPFHLKARPEPPIASWPTPGGKVRATAVPLAWAEQPDAARYHLQIAQDGSFGHLVHDNGFIQTTRQEVSLPVGDYVWRVASIRPNGDQGPFGDAQSFQLKAPPPQPEPPQVDEQFLHFNWSAEPGQTFEFQLATDEAFAHQLVTQAVTEPTIKVARPDQGGRLFIRYKAIDADGFVGPFTAPQVVSLPQCVQDGSGQCLRAGHGGRVVSPW